MKKIIILLAFFLLISCGFEPIYSKKKLDRNYNFTITNIGFSGDNGINQNIKNNLVNYINIEGKQTEYDLIIDSLVTKRISSKNKKGDAEIFFMQTTINVDVLEDDKVKNKISFVESFEYSNKSSKFELKKYEKSIKRNLASKLSEDILEYLYSIK